MRELDNMGRIIDNIIGGKKGAARRAAYGRLSGTVGIAANSALGAGKLLIGLATGSVAVMADAVNNLMDAASSVATLIGFRMASRERDREHPFGHARIEYMTGVIIAAMVTAVGVQLIIGSAEKILHPQRVQISAAAAAFLLALIAVKIWLWRFNIKLSRDIGSDAIKATAIDCRNDVAASAAVLLSVAIDKIVGFPTDGFVGAGVAVFIVISGMKLVRETAAPLLGQAPDKALVKDVTDFTLGHSGVIGVHDLVVHDYGPNNIFASVHVEVDADDDIMKSHEMIDMIERDAKKALDIELVCHMDPVDTRDPLVSELRESLALALRELPYVTGIHDLRIICGPTRTNVIFDVVTTGKQSAEARSEIASVAKTVLAETGGTMYPVITIDSDYT
ncbi:MAG: cation diffusion facilitator family transporter [Clostridiales Family XIII bacterium]|jgi:cation diffusion facilitator family transporter|nr:cation diffusion facilitator family transporter [Clostridiales Family XIII bacterium]